MCTQCLLKYYIERSCDKKNMQIAVALETFAYAFLFSLLLISQRKSKNAH